MRALEKFGHYDKKSSYVFYIFGKELAKILTRTSLKTLGTWIKIPCMSERVIS